MSNTLIAAVYIPLSLITATVLIEVFLRNAKKKGTYMFMLLCLLVIGWYSSDIAGVLTKSESVSKFLWSFLLIFVGFIPPVLLLFVMDFYRIALKRTKKLIPLIFIIPSVNTVMALTSSYHRLMYSRLEIISLAPVHEVVRVWGPWFWVHTVFCYVMSALIISVILLRHFKLPKFYRMPSTLMIIGISVTLAGNVITLLKFLPAAIDPTLIGTSLALIFFSFAIINNDRSKFVRYSSGKIFDYLDLYILVMDENGHVAHANRPAVSWLASFGISPYSSSMNEIMESLISKGAVQKESGNEKGADIYFPANPLPVVLNLHEQKMTDKNGDVIGHAAVFSDVTQNRLLLNQLEKKAGMDSLTGIANRTAYDGARKRLDSAEYLPLGVIMCDVNGLKAVNDNLGHQYGDMMLQVVSGILEAACPRQGFLARAGGDEFVYLLPRTSEAGALALTDKVRAMAASRKDLPFPLSVAMGAAVKLSVDENLSDVIDLADSRMYENKRRIKEAVRGRVE